MADFETFLADAIEICSVAAPTGKEGRRAAHMAKRLEMLGVPAATDRVGNVIGELPGDPGLPCVALVAHLDTVFPDEGEIAVRREGGFLVAPGIGDNSVGLAVLLAAARDLGQKGLGRVLLVASVGEEGNGDLLGARRLIEDRGPEIDVFIAVEGASRDRVVAAGVGVERLRFTITGPGGHSWGDAGTPSAIEGASRLIADLYDLPLPAEPRTSFGVGVIRGGQSINSIAAEAVFEVDLRSLGQVEVRDLEDRVLDAARRRFPEGEALGFAVEAIGSRPAGRLDPEHPLLRHIAAARRAAGLATVGPVASSTDANIPLAEGIPAVSLGVGIGEDVHKRTERFAVGGAAAGLAALLDAARRMGRDPSLVRRGNV